MLVLSTSEQQLPQQCLWLLCWVTDSVVLLAMSAPGAGKGLVLVKPECRGEVVSPGCSDGVPWEQAFPQIKI